MSGSDLNEMRRNAERPLMNFCFWLFAFLLASGLADEDCESNPLSSSLFSHCL